MKLLVLPSPQLIVPAMVSAEPGSVTVNFRPTTLPVAQAVPVLPVTVRALRTGDTLLAVYVNVAVVTPLSPSSALTTTVPLPLSVVPRLHDQVPSPLSVTAPSPLSFVMTMVSAATSVNEPDVLRVAPSLPVWLDGAVPTAGATFTAVTAKVSVGLVTPSLSVAWTTTVPVSWSVVGRL